MDNFKASVAQSDMCSLQLIKIVVGCDHITIEERSSWMNSFRFLPQATSAATSLNEHGAIYNGILPNLWGRKYLHILNYIYFNIIGPTYNLHQIHIRLDRLNGT